MFSLSETWLHDKFDTFMVNIKGYNAFRQDRNSFNSGKKRGGGLITYIKDTLDVYVQEANNTSTKDLEVQWLRIARHNSKNILLANVYRPPTGKLNLAIKTLDKDIKSLKNPNEEMIILGDFNVDYKN